MAVRCWKCSRRDFGSSPEALPLGWIALFVNCWFGRGGGMARALLPLRGYA
jgi:hypothetical protein